MCAIRMLLAMKHLGLLVNLHEVEIS